MNLGLPTTSKPMWRIKNMGGFYSCGEFDVQSGEIIEVDKEKADQLLADFPQNWELVGAVLSEPHGTQSIPEKRAYKKQYKMSVDLVMVTHNAEKDIRRALESLISHTHISYRLYIIDNSSKDDTRNIVVECLRDIHKTHKKILRLKNNLGYPKSCNKGFELGRGDVVIFLNSDLEFVDHEWLEKMCDALEDKAVGVAGAKLFDGKGVYQGRQRENWVCGAVFGVRREVFEQLGKFDEFYFYMWEETDFCELAYRNGFKIVETDAKVIHYYQRKSDDFFGEHYERGRRHFLKKYGHD